MKSYTKAALPMSQPAQRSVLAAMLLDPGACEAVTREGLVTGHFVGPDDQAIFDAIQSLIQRGSVVDPVSVSIELDKAEKLESIGGLTQLNHLANSVPALSLTSQHAREVYELAEFRTAILDAEAVSDAAYRQDRSALSRAVSRLASRTVAPQRHQSVDEIWQILADGADPTPAPTILADASGVGVIHADASVMLVGPAGIGKTWLAIEAGCGGTMRGKKLAWIDFDAMGQLQLVARAATLGYLPDDLSNENFRYFDGGDDFGGLSALLVAVEAFNPEMVVVDPLIGMLTLAGSDEKDNSEVRFVLQQLAQTLTKRRPRSLLVLDHTGHDAGRARGASAKAQWADQVIVIEAKGAFGIGRSGSLHLRSEKDRRGFFPARTSIAEIFLRPGPDLTNAFAQLGSSLSVTIQTCGATAVRETNVEDRILNAIRDAGGAVLLSDLRKGPIRGIPNGKQNRARASLSERGLIDQEKQSGTFLLTLTQAGIARGEA